MASKALSDLQDRLQDIEQLAQAHTAITKFRNAQLAANQPGGIAAAAAVLSALATQPGKGRPAQVGAINRSAFVLLCSHLQGFVDDLHAETAKHTLKGKVKNIDASVKLVKPRNSNPHADVIEKMFAGVGIYDAMEIRWKKCSSERVRKRLTKYIEERNKIAHGTRLKITWAAVNQFKDFVELLATNLDKGVAGKVAAIVGASPW